MFQLLNNWIEDWIRELVKLLERNRVRQPFGCTVTIQLTIGSEFLYRANGIFCCYVTCSLKLLCCVEYYHPPYYIALASFTSHRLNPVWVPCVYRYPFCVTLPLWLYGTVRNGEALTWFIHRSLLTIGCKQRAQCGCCLDAAINMHFAHVWPI